MGKQRTSRYFKTAGITFDVRSEYPLSDMTFHPRLSVFETHDPTPEAIVIEHFFTIPDVLRQMDKKDALSSRPMWTIFRTKDTWIYRKKPALPVSDKDTAIFEFDQAFTNCRVYSDFLSPDEYAVGRFISLTLFGCDQILLSRLLTGRQGVVLHSNGFIHNGRGNLLAGISGAGKTTLSKLLKAKGFPIVSDDRTIVRIEDSQPFIYGSWLHGTTPVITNGRHPLGSIFFLEQAKENKIIPLNTSHEKIAGLLQALVRPYTTAQEWNRLLGTVENLVESIACYQLLFDLSGDIIKRMEDLG